MYIILSECSCYCVDFEPMRSIGKVVKVNDLHDTVTRIMTVDTHNKSVHILYTTMTQNCMYSCVSYYCTCKLMHINLTCYDSVQRYKVSLLQRHLSYIAVMAGYGHES